MSSHPKKDEGIKRLMSSAKSKFHDSSAMSIPLIKIKELAMGIYALAHNATLPRFPQISYD
jgi:hypothetical protein